MPILFMQISTQRCYRRPQFLFSQLNYTSAQVYQKYVQTKYKYIPEYVYVSEEKYL